MAKQLSGNSGQLLFLSPEEFAMYEHQKILNKIERLVDQLPYRSVRIEVELKNQTLISKRKSSSLFRFYLL